MRPREPTTTRLRYRLRRGSLPCVWTSSDSVPRECLISRRRERCCARKERRAGGFGGSRPALAFGSRISKRSQGRRRLQKKRPPAYIIAVMLAIHVDASEDDVPLSIDLLKSLERGFRAFAQLSRPRVVILCIPSTPSLSYAVTNYVCRISTTKTCRVTGSKPIS